MGSVSRESSHTSEVANSTDDDAGIPFSQEQPTPGPSEEANEIVVDISPPGLFERNQHLKRKFYATIKSGDGKGMKKGKVSGAQEPYCKYFQEVDDGITENSQVKVKCIVSQRSDSGAVEICGEMLSYYAGNSYFNLKRHLQRKHGITIENVKSAGGGHRQLTLAETKEIQTKYPSTNKKQQLFDKNVLRMYAIDGCAFSTVQGHGFKALIEGLDPRITIKTRQTYSEQLKKAVHVEVIPRIRQKLNEIEKRFCHFSCDMWSTRSMEGVMCILAHFINDNWMLQQNVLLFESFNEQHTGAAIRGIFLKCLASYKVSADWGGVVVSDNAANMKNCFNLLNIGMDNEWRTLFKEIQKKPSSVVGDHDADSEEANANSSSDSDEARNSSDCDIESEYNPDDESEEDESTDFAARVVQQFAEEMFRSTLNLPITGHLFCAAHSLQLGINNALSKDHAVKDFISLVNKVMVFFKTSTFWRSELKKETVFDPVLAGKTRWNSTLDMLNRFRKPDFFRAARNVIDRVLLDCSSNRSTTQRSRLPPPLGVLQLQQAEELHAILQPMGIATDCLQSNGPTSNEVLLRVILAYRELLTVKTSVFETLRLNLLSNLKSRMDPYIRRKEYVIATLLDPRLKASLFQLRWGASQEMELSVPKRDEAIQHLEEAYNTERQLIDQNVLQARTKENVVSEGVFSIVKEALEIDQNPDKSEIDFYLEDLASDQSACPLEYWKANCKRFPILGRIARKYLAIPASSAGVERIFSISGSIARSRRARISTKKIAELLMLRYHDA